MPSEPSRPTLQSRTAEIQARISRACAAAGRDMRSVRMLAVSKTRSLANIRDLFQTGQREFAENYASELCAKAEQLHPLPITWVFIGQLQSNKIKRIVAVAAEIQSVASSKHLAYIARYAQEFGKVPFPIYLEVNAGAEASKGGVSLSEVEALAAEVRAFPELALQGLMVIPPQFSAAQRSQQAELYGALRSLASRIGRGKLSLGMSEDLEAAVAAGSDCVRIGTALFGPRTE